MDNLIFCVLYYIRNYDLASKSCCFALKSVGAGDMINTTINTIPSYGLKMNLYSLKHCVKHPVSPEFCFRIQKLS